MKKILDWIKTNLLGIEKPRRKKKPIRKSPPSRTLKRVSVKPPRKKIRPVKPTARPNPKPAPKRAAVVKVQKSVKPPAKTPKKPVPKAPAPVLKKTGVITHFFPNVQAAIVKMTAGAVEIGDEIHFKGPVTDFKITVKSMQMNRAPILVAEKGQEIGIQVPDKVREGDVVFRVVKK